MNCRNVLAKMIIIIIIIIAGSSWIKEIYCDNFSSSVLKCYSTAKDTRAGVLKLNILTIAKADNPRGNRSAKT